MTHLIYETKALADAAIATFNTRFIDLLESQGSTKLNGGILPKVQGMDAPQAPRTTHYDVVREYVEGWGFATPRGTQFDADADSLLDGLGGTPTNATNFPSEID